MGERQNIEATVQKLRRWVVGLSVAVGACVLAIVMLAIVVLSVSRDYPWAWPMGVFWPDGDSREAVGLDPYPGESLDKGYPKKLHAMFAALQAGDPDKAQTILDSIPKSGIVQADRVWMQRRIDAARKKR